MLNMMFNLNLPVGLGDTTTKCQDVASVADGVIHIWDCPGDNRNFGI